MSVVKIKENIFDVGVTDWNIRDFHGYSTDKGTSYNAFLCLDEKNVLIDTVKSEFSNQLITNISKIIDPKKIDFLISNHTEMDHSGSIPKLMHLIGEDKPVYCSKMGAKNLKDHFGGKYNFQPVKNGSTISTGSKSFTFLETRMIHWPDSMFTYLKEDKILFSSDGFGQHFAGVEKFDDQLSESEIMPLAKKYYANILSLFSHRIAKLIDDVVAMNLDIDIICPDHGIYWRKDPMKIIKAYANWAKQESKNKAVVIYDTMWKSTEQMAYSIVEGISESNIDVVPMHNRKWHRSDIMTEVMDAKAIIVGSPTLNNTLFPTIADILTYMRGLKPVNKIGAAFGSFGWSGEAVKHINAELERMDFEIIDPGLKVKYVPDEDGLNAALEFGRKIAAAIKG